MKTKTITKERNQQRQETAVLKNIKKDFKNEFTDILDDSFIDELAMSELEDWDD